MKWNGVASSTWRAVELAGVAGVMVEDACMGSHFNQLTLVGEALEAQREWVLRLLEHAHGLIVFALPDAAHLTRQLAIFHNWRFTVRCSLCSFLRGGGGGGRGLLRR